MVVIVVIVGCGVEPFAGLESIGPVVGGIAAQKRPMSLLVVGLVVCLRLRISVEACDFDRTFSGRVHNSSLNVDE